jgi:hypothetical protein
MELRSPIWTAVVLALSGAACERRASDPPEIFQTWRATAPKDDAYDTRCNDARRRLAEPLGQAIGGFSRQHVIELLGQPDERSHSEAEIFGADNLNYSLGFCDGDYRQYVVSFRSGRVVGAREVPY